MGLCYIFEAYDMGAPYTLYGIFMS